MDRVEKLLIGSKEVLTFDEASDYRGISRSFLYKLTASGEIPHYKPNGKWSFLIKKGLWIGCFNISENPKLEIKDNSLAGNLVNKNG